ncbi:MAG TPA: hypothetical protein PLV92_08915, partial [Pirellulaceae bacterium]|nr:hypothetical protein [Pirellulaceae bacterium]
NANGTWSWTFNTADGPDQSQTVTITATDSDGAASTSTFALVVNNVAPTVTANVASITVTQGVTATNTGTVSDPGLDTVTLSVNEGVIVNNGNGTWSWSWNTSAAAVGTRTIVVTATDSDGASSTASFTVVVNASSTGHTPTLTNLAATRISENGTTSLTGRINDSDAGDTFTLAVNWGDPLSPNNTQTFTFPAGTTTFTLSHKYLDDNPTASVSDIYTIGLTVTDSTALSSTGSTTVIVDDVAPVVTGAIAGRPTAVPGQPLTYSVAGFTDVGTLDTHVTAWTVKNSSNVVVGTGSGLGMNFTPTVPGTYTVSFKVTDDDGLSTTVTKSVVVSYANIQDGVCCPGVGQALFIGSLTVNDRIQVSPIGNAGKLQVKIINQVTGGVVFQQQFTPPTGGFSQIVIYGQGADDQIQISGSIEVPALVHAGAGNDQINGGAGNNILLGEAGNDTIIGGSGRDLMIGGTGADRIIGNAGDDILIAGTTAFDANDEALCAIMKEWSRTDLSYCSRVAHISGSNLSTPRLNGNWFLKSHGPGKTVFADNSVDRLTGSAGDDWFFANIHSDGGSDGAMDIITDDDSDEHSHDCDSAGHSDGDSDGGSDNGCD